MRKKKAGVAIRRVRGGAIHVDCVKLYDRMNSGLLTDTERTLYCRVFGKSPEELHAAVAAYIEPAGDIPLFPKRAVEGSVS